MGKRTFEHKGYKVELFTFMNEIVCYRVYHCGDYVTGGVLDEIDLKDISLLLEDIEREIEDIIKEQ